MQFTKKAQKAILWSRIHLFVTFVIFAGKLLSFRILHLTNPKLVGIPCIFSNVGIPIKRCLDCLLTKLLHVENSNLNIEGHNRHEESSYPIGVIAKGPVSKRDSPQRMFGRPQQQQQYPTRQNYQTADMPVGAGQHASASPRMHASPNTLQVNPNPLTSTSGLLLTSCFLGYGLILNQPSTELFIVLITQPLSPISLTILGTFGSQGFFFLS